MEAMGKQPTIRLNDCLLRTAPSLEQAGVPSSELTQLRLQQPCHSLALGKLHKFFQSAAGGKRKGLTLQAAQDKMAFLNLKLCRCPGATLLAFRLIFYLCSCSNWLAGWLAGWLADCCGQLLL